MDRTRRVCREDAGRLLGLTEPSQELRQAFRLRRQRLDLFLQRQDAPDPLQVDALTLAEMLDVTEFRDILQGVAPPSPTRPFRDDEPQPVIAAQGLRVHVGQLRRHRDREDRRLGVERLGQVLSHVSLQTAQPAGLPGLPSRRTPAARSWLHH